MAGPVACLGLGVRPPAGGAVGPSPASTARLASRASEAIALDSERARDRFPGRRCLLFFFFFW
jgi:hypothetical protein